MGWWSIVKSSRKEAYSAFLEEFGPEVDLKFLEVESFLDDPENADVEYYLSVSNVSDEIMGHWVIQSNGANIRFVSDKYSQYQDFVLGMFQQEYPERYKDIAEMFDAATPAEQRMINTLDNKDVIYASADLPDFRNMSSSDRAKWLREHDFCYLANGNFVRIGVRNYLIGSLISFYNIKSADEVTALLISKSYSFGEFTNIADLFYEYTKHMDDFLHSETRLVRRKLESTIGQFEVLQDILRGRLLRNPYHMKQFGRDGGVTLAIKRRRPGEE